MLDFYTLYPYIELDTMNSDTYVSLRCPTDKQRGPYNSCGHLLALLDKDGNILLYCGECKTFYKLTVYENLNVEMEPLPKNQRLRLVSNLRLKL